MSSQNQLKIVNNSPNHLVGVGLRHTHFHDALEDKNTLDFIEVHTENFFAEGGMANVMLEAISERYRLSFHGTAMGLGSVDGIDQAYLKKLSRLVNKFNPEFISDHASFSWVKMNGKKVHMGDLLPLPKKPQSLNVLAYNVDHVQQSLGRQLLVENIVSYFPEEPNEMTETDFLNELVEKTGCGLLVDINNILVNNINMKHPDPYAGVQKWLDDISADSVKELHLAGYTPSESENLIIDDHGQPVSSEGWALFEYALTRFPQTATLIEWDNALPTWSRLLQEADKAMSLIHNHQTIKSTRHEFRHTQPC